MRVASLQDIKNELKELSQKELVELCQQLARYKKDNKEYLGYLLFEAHHKDEFVKEVKKEIEEHFVSLKTQNNLYFAKKSLRKILRLITKYSKYTADNPISIELSIYFLQQLKNSGLNYRTSRQIMNMYRQQLKKINALLLTLHEDLQGDYLGDIEEITEAEL